MKRFFENEAVAWCVLILCVIISVSVNTRGYSKYVKDKADALSQTTIEKIHNYNKTWNKKYDAKVYVAVFEDLDGEDLVRKVRKFKLDENDGVIVISVGNEPSYYIDGGENFKAMFFYNDFEADTQAYLENATGDTKVECLSSINSGLTSYFGYLDKRYSTNRDPESVASAAALENGFTEFIDGFAAIASGSLSLVGSIVGWGFSLIGRILKWLAGLGTFGIIIVIIIVVKVFSD